MKHRTTFILAALLAVVLTASGFQDSPQYKILFEKAKFTMETKGDLNGAITLFNEIIKKYPKEREYAAKSQLNIGLCYEKLGANQAQKAYQTVVDTWPDQTEMVALAKTKLTQLTGVVAESNLRAEQSFKLAGDLYKEFKYESAVAEYEKVIKMAPKSKLAEEAQLWIGQCYFKEGKNDQALASFNTIKKDYPQSTIVPVTELMISQVKQAIATKPNRKPIVTLDDKTILDPATGIRYTRINTLAGKNDVITSASTITAISPNRKFVLVKNKVIPFGTGDSFEVFDFPASGWLTSELSPDGTRIAYLTENSISVISISPETGRPAGPGKILVSGKYNQSDLFSWSPDGEKLVLSLGVSNGISNLWTLSTRDSELKQITNGKSIDWAPLFAKNGKNILFKRFTNIIMRPAEGFRSVIIADSCASYYHEFYLSPNNQWIIYPDNDWKNSFSLFRVGDKQKQDLSFPQEVGDIVSWTNQDKKVYFFSPSTEYNESLEVVSVMGGPAIELESQFGQYPIGWSPNSRSLIATSYSNSEQSVVINDLTDKVSKTIEGTAGFNIISFSPDYSKIILGKSGRERISELSISAISLKDCKLTGEPVVVFKGANTGSYNIFWSPDGEKIAIGSGGDIWICNADGSPAIQLTKTPIREFYPNWSPDGTTIAIYNENNQLLITKVSDGAILRTFEKVESFDWLPKGNEIIIAYSDGQLSAEEVTSGKARKITNWKEAGNNPQLNYLDCSPDGKWIGINTGNGINDDYKTKMYLITVADGKTTELASDNSRNKDMVVWSPDSKWIAFNTNESKKTYLESTLWEADLTDFMGKMKPGKETGYTTDLDIKALASKLVDVKPDGTFTDSRDGHVYKYKNIGEQTWMAENLTWLPEVTPSSERSSDIKRYYVYDYEGSDVKAAMNTENYQKYGALYNWPAALNAGSAIASDPAIHKGVCPAGWHIPAYSEWMQLEKYLGMNGNDLAKAPGAIRFSGEVGKKIKSSVGWEDDEISFESIGFNAKPGGMLGGQSGKFVLINRFTTFWTSPSADNIIYTFGLSITHSATFYNSYPKGIYAMSVRCIKDK